MKASKTYTDYQNKLEAIVVEIKKQVYRFDDKAYQLADNTINDFMNHEFNPMSLSSWHKMPVMFTLKSRYWIYDYKHLNVKECLKEMSVLVLQILNDELLSSLEKLRLLNKNYVFPVIKNPISIIEILIDFSDPNPEFFDALFQVLERLQEPLTSFNFYSFLKKNNFNAQLFLETNDNKKEGQLEKYLNFLKETPIETCITILKSEIVATSKKSFIQALQQEKSIKIKEKLDNLLDLLWIKGISITELAELYHLRFGRQEVYPKLIEKIMFGTWTAKQCNILLDAQPEIQAYIIHMNNDNKKMHVINTILEKCGASTQQGSHGLFRMYSSVLKLLLQEKEKLMRLLDSDTQSVIAMSIPENGKSMGSVPNATLVVAARANIPKELRDHIQATIRVYEGTSFLDPYYHRRFKKADFLKQLLEKIDLNRDMSYDMCIDGVTHAIPDVNDIHHITGEQNKEGHVYRILHTLRALDDGLEHQGDAVFIPKAYNF